MSNALKLAVLGFSLVTSAVRGDPPEESTLPIVIASSEIEWKGIFGGRENDERTAFVLMATEFMSLPFLSGEPNECQDLEKVVAVWLAQHPAATATPVHQIPLGDDHSFVFVWVAQDQENLNVWLVRKGCATARQMVVDDPRDLLVKAEDYQRFLDSVKDAEAIAIREKVGIWGKPGADRGAHWTTAERLEEQGKYAEAIAEFQAAIVAGFDADSAWHRIARCYESLGQYASAIKAYDESLRLADSDSIRRWTLISKAVCVGKLEGSAKAAQAFGIEKPDCSKSLEPCMDLAVAHSASGHVAEAVKVTEKGIWAFIAHNELKFDGQQFVFDEPRAKRSEKYFSAVQELGRGLPILAMYSIRADNGDKAFQFATMALSVDHAWMEYLNDRFDKDRFDLAVIEAGDFNARLVLAKVYANQGKFEEAKREVDQAKILIDVGYLQGGYSKEILDSAYGELQSQFPDRKVEIPPTYKPQPKKKGKPPSPEEVAAMGEEQLIANASADDPATSFAALEELVVRHSRGAVSATGLNRLVKDGLDRQADTTSRWRSQYGVFIEDAWDKGTLSETDIMRYVRGSVVVQEIDVSCSDLVLGEENAYVSARGRIEGRLGGSLALARKGIPKARLSALVALEEITIDGVKRRLATRHMPSREPHIINLGHDGGFGGDVADTRDLPEGAHSLTATGKITIYLGDLTRRPLDFDCSTVEPVVVIPFSVSNEFEVERE